MRTCKNCEARGGKIEDGYVSVFVCRFFDSSQVSLRGVVVQTYTVVGYQDCPNHQKVADLLAILVGKYPTHLRGEIVGGSEIEISTLKSAAYVHSFAQPIRKRNTRLGCKIRLKSLE